MPELVVDWPATFKARAEVNKLLRAIAAQIETETNPEILTQLKQRFMETTQRLWLFVGTEDGQ